MTAAVLPFVSVVLLWAVFLLDKGYDLDLHRYGLLPRSWKGLIGVFTAPLLHGDIKHIFNNSVAGLMLGWCLMYFYPRNAGRVVAITWLAGGSAVWLMGRTSYHIGASGVVYGMAAFLFFSGILRRQRTLTALSLIIVFFYGGLVWGVFPIVPHMSWESHLWGGLVGGAMAYVYRAIPPAISDPRPAFADDPDDELEEDDGVITAGDPGDEAERTRPQWQVGSTDHGNPATTSSTWDRFDG